MNNQVEYWKALREQGLTYQQIADNAGITRQGVWDALNKLGVPHKTKYSQYYEEWENLYHLGWGVHTIAEKYNCSHPTVLKYLSKKVVIDASESALRAWKKRRKKARKKSIESQV